MGSRRKTAVFLSAVMILVAVCALFVCVMDASHDCPGEACFVCEAVGTFLHSTFGAAALTAAAFLLPFAHAGGKERPFRWLRQTQRAPLCTVRQNC